MFERKKLINKPLTNTNRQRIILSNILNRSCNCAYAFLSCHDCEFQLDQIDPYFPRVNYRQRKESENQIRKQYLLAYIQCGHAFQCSIVIILPV